ncbi:hypothetical protein J7E87_19460 [Streptomyces sp. ISL-1]|uniref:hypothetical protein n=1 Tax=Streptomyces sp. ISL-1 TaxID=2817657 RepID=UPI001BE7D644|nr:hypothetical protein [Streptomyces sp. ISL-1]MBT2391551.1 hypothetical protein [Streptomyces sp. ISL-1]
MHVSLRHGAIAGLAISSLLLISACDGGSDSAKASGSKTKNAPPAPPTYISSKQAEQALVTGAELAEGWQREPDTIIDKKAAGAEEESLKGVRKACAPLAEILNSGRPDADHKATAQAVFYKKGEETNLAQDVSGYPRAQAVGLMSGLRTAIKECGSFDGTMSGKKAKVKVTTLEVPKYGDESVGYAISITSDDMVMDFDMATVRSVGGITTLRNNYSDTGDRGKGAFNEGLAHAAEKLKAATAKTV